MIHFEHTQLLWLLILIPLLAAAWVIERHLQRKRLGRFADTKMLGRLVPDASRYRPTFKIVLILMALALLIIALANPQAGTRLQEAKRQGSDIAICLDISNSMMAEDIQPNRLERSKRAIGNLLSELAGDRVSLVIFAGTSFVQMPLTNDYSAAKLFLDQISCDQISTQGTAIGDAINTAMQTLGYDDPDREWVRSKGRAIIIISDGENHEDDAVAAAQKAASEDVRVCTIGMGLNEGTPIPEYDSRGRRNSYKRAQDGSIVMTKLNETMLSEIARAGNGAYVRAGNASNSMNEVLQVIEKLDKEQYGEATFSEYESRYQYPLSAAIICLVAEILIYERRNRRFNLQRLLQKNNNQTT
ncbi:MAG: VWA domain-containing protein [Bacteroidales bacterium]|nr:VWA domain-containing protein [Bacteroidales bacterium]